MKKKILSLMLAMVMMLSLSVTAFAEETTYTDQEKVTIKKTYTATNAGTSNQAETFYLVQTDSEVVDGEADSAPALIALTGEDLPDVEEGTTIVGSVYFAEGSATSTDDIEITLPEYDTVGIYKYTLQEVQGTTAGVTYFSGDIYLVVTVINGDDGSIRVAAVHTETSWDGTANNEGKSDTIENTYDAGSLTISKEVTGNLGDTSKYFKVTVTLTGETGMTYADSYEVEISGADDLPASVGTNPTTIVIGDETVFYVKDGTEITIDNLPYGVTYTVVEDDYTESDGYEDADYDFSDENKKIDSASDTVEITNTKTGEVDTGISLDSLPYILMLIVVAAGVVVMISRRRLDDRF